MASDKHRANRDARVGVSCEIRVADGASVDAALYRLQFVDEFHRADLGRAGDGPGREARREHVRRSPVVGDGAGDGRDEVHHAREPLDRRVALHFDGPDAAGPPEVVPSEIDEHEVFGPLLRVGDEFGFERGVLLGCRAPPPRPSDGQHLGTALIARPLDADEHFGRRARELEAVEVEVKEVGRGVHLAERAVEVERVAVE